MEAQTQRKAVFLDRDGVLNETFFRGSTPIPPASPKDLVLREGVLQGLLKLKKQGYLLIVVTNQPDVGRGLTPQIIVESINKKLMEMLPLNDLFVCYAGEDSDPRRKPNPGMILDASRQYNIDLESSFMVGDRWKDIEAGAAAGCFTIFVDNSYKEQLRRQPDAVADSFADVVSIISAQLQVAV